MVTWDINKVNIDIHTVWSIDTARSQQVGNEETVAMIKREGNKAFCYTVDMSSKCVVL